MTILGIHIMKDKTLQAMLTEACRKRMRVPNKMISVLLKRLNKDSEQAIKRERQRRRFSSALAEARNTA